MARFRVDVDGSGTGHVRRRTGRRVARFRRFQGDVIHEHGVVAQVLDGDFLPCRQVGDGLAVKFQIVDTGRAEFDGSPFFHALYQALAGLDDGIARKVRRRRRIGAAVIRRRIRIDAIGDDVVDRAEKTFRSNLGQDSITARPHIGSADIEGIEAVVVDLDGDRGDVDVGNARPLHGRSDADSPDMAIGQDLTRAVVVPAGHLDHPFQALVEGTAQGRFIEISRHDLSLTDQVLQAQGHRTHVQGCCQFIDGRFQGKQALGRTVTAIGTGGDGISIDAGITEAESFGCIIQGNRFMPRQRDRRRRMFAISTGVPQGIDEDAADMAVLAGAEDDADLRFMARRRYGHGFFPAVNHIRRFSRQPGNIRRIDFHDGCLLGAEAAADARLDDADLRFRDFQGIGNDAADVERNLRRTDDGQAAEGVLIGIGPERFHSALLVLARMISPVDDDIR